MLAHTAALVAASVLMVPLAGCAPAAEPTPAASDSSPNESAPATSQTPAETDSAENPAGGVTLVDNPSTPADVVVISGSITDASWDQSAVSLATGDILTFSTTDGGPFAVIVGDLDGITVAKGMPASFRFDQPGSYTALDGVSGTATLTVTVG